MNATCRGVARLTASSTRLDEREAEVSGSPFRLKAGTDIDS
jgi:hypothetical protein